MAKASRRLLRPELAGVNSRLLSLQTRVASIPALIRVTQSLGVDAECIVFGHVHRLGPLPGDDETDWEDAGGEPRVVNTGSWIYEPLLVRMTYCLSHTGPGRGDPQRRADPQPIGLLDAMPADALH